MTGYLRQSPTFLQLITFIGFFLLFFAVYIFALHVISPMAVGMSLEEMQSKVFANPNLVGYLKITQLFYTIVAFFVPAAIFAYLWKQRPAEYLGLKTMPSFLQVILALLVMYGCLPAVGWLGQWNESLPIPQELRNLEKTAEQLLGVMLKMPSIADLFINLFLVAIIPAIGEELFFRGVMQRLITETTRKPWLSIFITAILFSAIHGDALAFIPRIALGFIIGAIYLVSGSLWLAIFAHILNNGMQVIWLYLFQHGIVKDDPMQATPVAWYLAVLSIPVAIGLLWALKKKSAPYQLITPKEEATK